MAPLTSTGRKVGFVAVVVVGYAVSGVIDDEVLLLRILYVGNLVLKFLFEDHPLGGVLSEVNVLSWYSEAFFAVFGEYACIMNGVWHRPSP